MKQPKKRIQGKFRELPNCDDENKQSTSESTQECEITTVKEVF
jgi:hypothetical protein